MTVRTFGRAIIYILISVSFFACSKEQNFEENNSFLDTKHAYSAVEALYGQGAPAFYAEVDSKQGPMLAYGGYLSGYFSNESASANTIADACCNLSLNSPAIQKLSENITNQCLSAIAAADDVIERLLHTEELGVADKDTLLGEARFFRSFNRFYLLKTYGLIPSVTKLKDDSSEESTETLQESYEQIIADLKFAIPVLAEKTFSENKGRITSFAAQALLADVYLTMSGYPLQSNRYKEAALVARSLIESGKHSLAVHVGTDDEASAYNQLRLSPSNPEYIYVYKSMRTDAIPLTTFALPYKAASWPEVKLSVTNNAYMPTPNFMKLYNEGDLRAKDRQFFHSFYKYEHEGKTIFELFTFTPYFWYREDLVSGDGNPTEQCVGIYRFAEILLIAAEAVAETEGVTPESVGWLAAVRSRAFPQIAESQLEAELSALSKEEFIREVWLERLRELPFEMKIWVDIQRTRMYPVVSSGESGKRMFVPITGAKNPNGISYSVEQLLLH